MTDISSWVSKIHIGKCENLIPELPDESIDLVITSPPYNVNLGKNKYRDKGYDEYNDEKEHNDFIAWLKSIFTVLKQKLVSGGRVCINIGDGKNGSLPTHSDIIHFMHRELGYLIKSTIIWNKHQTSNRAAWGSWLSPSNPSFPSAFEYILIFCKDSQKKSGERTDITLTKKEFIENSNSIWTFAPEKNLKKLGHPAPFPIELPRRLIQQLSYKNDVVLDIFSGSGTTCLAAEILRRQWIGFEMSEAYAKISSERIINFMNQNKLSL